MFCTHRKGTDVDEMLRQLEDQLPRPGWLGSQRLQMRRLWHLAEHLRDKQFHGQVTKYELFSLFADTLLYCLRRFDLTRAPREGAAGRRTLADRFTWFFAHKFVWSLQHYASRLRGDSGRTGSPLFRGPRGKNLASAVRLESQTGRVAMVRWALGRLDAPSRALVEQRFWEELSMEGLADSLGFADRYAAKRALDRVLRRLKGIILAVA